MVNKDLTISFEYFLRNNKEKFKNQNIAIAVSGGSDSLALAILSKIYAKKYKFNIIAFTLDHKLRKESARETLYVQNIMKKLEIKHYSLVWSEKKPQTRIQEKARIMRYNILGDACIKYNCKYIFLGHHANDQVETFIIRLGAKSGLEGLGCMKEFSRILIDSGPLEIVRPLLNYSKESLINICKINNLKWVEDPSNSDAKYLRSKTRKLLVYKDMVEDFSRALKLFEALSLNINSLVHKYICNDIEFSNVGICRLNLNNFSFLPEPLQLRALTFVIKIIGGKKYPRRSKVMQNLLQNIKIKNKNIVTVGGSLVKISKDNIVFSRLLDNSIITSKLNKPSTLWDRRFLVLNKTKRKNITIGPLGEKDYLSMIKLNKIEKPSINFNAIKTLPAIRVLEQVVSIPHLLYWKSDFWKNNIKVTHVEHKLLEKYKNIDIFKNGEKI